MENMTDAEMQVMEVLWDRGIVPAGLVARVLKESTGWSRNTTYTLINRCIEKGAIRRLEPGFQCEALVGRDEVRQRQANSLVKRFFEGSPALFFATLLDGRGLSSSEAEQLHELIDKASEDAKEDT